MALPILSLLLFASGTVPAALGDVGAGQAVPWASDEAMKRSDDQYRFTIVVEHNRAPVVAGAGSCIFLHAWPAPGIASPGCTMMAFPAVKDLLTWLDPRAQPVLVQLPKTIAEKATAAWELPGEIH